VIREGEQPRIINGIDANSNVGRYTITNSDKNGFTLRCYNINFNLSTPTASISKSLLPDCEYCAKIC